MSSLELVFTGNNGKEIRSLIDFSIEDTPLDIADNAQEALDNYAKMICNADIGFGDNLTLMCEPEECERDDWKTIFL